MNTDKAARYHRLKRAAAVSATIVTAGILIALTASGASARLRDLSDAAGAESAAASSPAAIAIYVVVLCAILQVAALPIAYYKGVVLERRYGLSAESIGGWFGDYLKAALVSVVLGVAGAELLYLTIRRWPDVWWLAAAGGFGVAMLLLAQATPVLLLPLFYRFKRLDRPELQERLHALSNRAGLPALGVYEWGLGDKTRRANAALVGAGRTRRILLSDTLLADYSDDEIEVILAHELAHHAHRDVLKAVAAQTILFLLGFAAADWALAAMTRRSASLLLGAADVAGLPVILLASGAVSVALTPLLNALSRLHEHWADAYALRATRRPDAFISAMRRLGAQNLAEPQPSRLVVWLFHSHPPIEERIERARNFNSTARK